ncbi:hypothetical protein BDZ94DRAFT_1288503 [Collybia nuda]|uniref:Wings apart-like protein C-terminal domain-containing protein n=1 Tax=Collybia nuda TaxID=64659 RepID=A0A9P5YE40_9AGAR|nr:hypothetical protein BDZ94DRAFT_1288503 [Collybia nuda]
MPSSYASSSYNARTYSRKLSAKRRSTLEDAPGDRSEISQTQPRKRRKVSVEVPEPTMPSKERQRSQEILTDPEQDSTPSPPRKVGSVLITYGSPKRKPKSPSPPLRTPHRTPIPARDLSSIFKSVTPTHSSPTPSPIKLAKRMLARSKTDSSIDVPTSTSNVLFERFERTPSLPNLPSSSPPKHTYLSSSQDTLPPPPPPVPLPVTTRTYAGKSRSFLVAIPTSNLAGSNLFTSGVEDEEDEYSTRESYSSLRTRWGVDNSEDDPHPPYPTASPSRSDTTSTPSGSPKKSGKGKGKGGTTKEGQSAAQVQIPLPNGMMNPLKSITELRSKGESRRFLDEVGYLFEGMESSGGIGLRRASALEITTKLCDAEFARKAKAADFLGRIWDVFWEAGAGRGEDKILDTLLAFFAALVARDPTSLADLGLTSASVSSKQKSSAKRDSSLVNTLFALLANPADPLAFASASSKGARADQDAEFRKMGIGKKDRGLFFAIHQAIVSSSSLFSTSTPVSTPLLLTHALQALPPSLLTTNHLPELLISLQDTLSTLISPSSSYLSWPDTACTISYDNVYNHLRLLDTYLLGQWSDLPSSTEDEENDAPDYQSVNDRKMAQARDGWLVDALIALSICAEIDDGSSARECAEILFRVLVSLTHGDETWATKVIENECTLPFLAREIAHSSKQTSRGFRSGTRVKREERVKNEADENKDEATLGSNGEDPGRDEQIQSLDRLCLALGLLTNLVQAIESVKDLLRDIRLDPACTLKRRACIRQCTCSPEKSSLNILDILVNLYIIQLPPTQTIKSESTPPTDTVDASFLRGHLAVMFGLLMRGSPENQEYILNRLDGTSVSPRGKLNRLVDQARDFVAFYAALSSHPIDPDISIGGDVPEGGRRELDVERERESKVAKGVVRFLEGLRDRVEL